MRISQDSLYLLILHKFHLFVQQFASARMRKTETVTITIAAVAAEIVLSLPEKLNNLKNHFQNFKYLLLLYARNVNGTIRAILRIYYLEIPRVIFIGAMLRSIFFWSRKKNNTLILFTFCVGHSLNGNNFVVYSNTHTTHAYFHGHVSASN